MTDTASRPDTTPAVATLIVPDAAEGIQPPDTVDPPTRSWSWPASAPPVETGKATDVSDAEAAAVDADPSSAETEVSVTGVVLPETTTPAMTPSLGPIGRQRSTLAVVALSIVTLGVYSLVWHNRVNREIGYFDTRMHVIPGRSALAVTIPWVLGWLVSLAGAVRIVLAVLNVNLPFDPHFSVLQAYGLLAGVLVIPYLELLLPFSAMALVMTLERVRIVEDRIGRTTDVQLRPVRAICWLLLPIAGGLVLMAMVQRRLNRVWQDEKAMSPLMRPSATVVSS
jgi:xanthosine utilization system XapX-like protein